ncbi:MAG: histidine phosphatase family protein [Nocardioidaceae bacterium]|nr:histidine phosphatase family protein [Nocardioidaceae bacterium]
MERTIVHLMRHGEVNNPNGILYGQLPDFHLSPLGEQMATRVAEWLRSDHDLAFVVASPLERAQETAQPIAAAFGLEIHTDERVIESGNLFQGKVFGVGNGALRQWRSWWLLRNPFTPSWGEPYQKISERMLAAMASARDEARGRDALIVSHQLPIWTARSAVERRRFAHDPRKRQCTLASLTSFRYEGDQVVSVAYHEPARDLLPAAGKKFAAGA